MTQLIKIESPYEYPLGAVYRYKDDDALHPSLLLACSFNLETEQFEYCLSDGKHGTMITETEPLPEEQLYERAFLPMKAHLDAYKASCEGAKED